MDEELEKKYNCKYEILTDDYTQYDVSFKIIVIGDSGVGKSCLTNKATKNIFEDNYQATVGFEFFTFNLKINDKIAKLQIWDTCGQEIYRSLISNFYRNSSLALIVYSVTSRESFNNIDMWLKELRTQANPDVQIILIGNKVDLENERKVTKEEGELFAKKNGIKKFVETSAKTGINAQSTFVEIGLSLYNDYLKYKDEEDFDIEGSIKYSPSSHGHGQTIKKVEKKKLNEKNKKNCC